MNELYCLINIILIFYISFITIKKRKVIFGVFIFPFLIFYQVGFILLSAFPEGNYWDYLYPNYSKSLLFSLGEGSKAIKALLVINLSIIIGNLISEKILEKKYFPFIKDQQKENVRNIHHFVFLFSSVVFLISFSFICYRFLILKDLPIVNLLIHGGYARTFTNIWGFNEDVGFLFKSSIVRQFAQILMPLSALLSLSLNRFKTMYFIQIYVFFLCGHYNVCSLRVFKKNTLNFMGIFINVLFFFIKKRIISKEY